MRYCIAILSALLLVGCVSTRTQLTNGIPNLQEPALGVWCGGQPEPAGWAWLSAQGVTNIVKLNPWSEKPDLGAVQLGMDVHCIALDFDDQFLLGPKLSDVQAAVRQIRQGTFVHCTHGWDRTRLIIACWRLTQGWTKEAAEKEMLAWGFNKLPGLWAFWQKQKAEDWKP